MDHFGSFLGNFESFWVIFGPFFGAIFFGQKFISAIFITFSISVITMMIIIMMMLVTTRRVAVAQFRGNLDDRRESVGRVPPPTIYVMKHLTNSTLY